MYLLEVIGLINPQLIEYHSNFKLPYSPVDPTSKIKNLLLQ
jgi:hypothetical protein